MATGRLVPWICWGEWESVGKGLLGSRQQILQNADAENEEYRAVANFVPLWNDGPGIPVETERLFLRSSGATSHAETLSLLQALDRVASWRQRGRVPLAVDCTAALRQAQAEDGVFLRAASGTAAAAAATGTAPLRRSSAACAAGSDFILTKMSSPAQTAGFSFQAAGAAVASVWAGGSPAGGASKARGLISVPVHGGVFGGMAMDGCYPGWSYRLRLQYALPLLRLVNGVADSQQRGRCAASVAALSEVAGMPRMLVDVRHAATHGELPSLPLLRAAATQAMRWLALSYWEKQRGLLADAVNRIQAMLTQLIQSWSKELGSGNPEVATEESNRRRVIIGALKSFVPQTTARLLAAAVLDLQVLTPPPPQQQQPPADAATGNIPVGSLAMPLEEESWRAVMSQLCSEFPRLKSLLLTAVIGTELRQADGNGCRNHSALSMELEPAQSTGMERGAGDVIEKSDSRPGLILQNGEKAIDTNPKPPLQRDMEIRKEDPEAKHSGVGNVLLLPEDLVGKTKEPDRIWWPHLLLFAVGQQQERHNSTNSGSQSSGSTSAAPLQGLKRSSSSGVAGSGLSSPGGGAVAGKTKDPIAALAQLAAAEHSKTTLAADSITMPASAQSAKLGNGGKAAGGNRFACLALLQRTNKGAGKGSSVVSDVATPEGPSKKRRIEGQIAKGTAHPSASAGQPTSEPKSPLLSSKGAKNGKTLQGPSDNTCNGGCSSVVVGEEGVRVDSPPEESPLEYCGPYVLRPFAPLVEDEQQDKGKGYPSWDLTSMLNPQPKQQQTSKGVGAGQGGAGREPAQGKESPGKRKGGSQQSRGAQQQLQGKVSKPAGSSQGWASMTVPQPALLSHCKLLFEYMNFVSGIRPVDASDASGLELLGRAAKEEARLTAQQGRNLRWLHWLLDGSASGFQTPQQALDLGGVKSSNSARSSGGSGKGGMALSDDLVASLLQKVLESSATAEERDTLLAVLLLMRSTEGEGGEGSDRRTQQRQRTRDNSLMSDAEGRVGSKGKGKLGFALGRSFSLENLSSSKQKLSAEEMADLRKAEVRLTGIYMALRLKSDRGALLSQTPPLQPTPAVTPAQLFVVLLWRRELHRIAQEEGLAYGSDGAVASRQRSSAQAIAEAVSNHESDVKATSPGPGRGCIDQLPTGEKLEDMAAGFEPAEGRFPGKRRWRRYSEIIEEENRTKACAAALPSTIRSTEGNRDGSCRIQDAAADGATARVDSPILPISEEEGGASEGLVRDLWRRDPLTWRACAIGCLPSTADASGDLPPLNL